jgi:CubicO group peptidase (beta-lactamase class C family)/peptidoglycan/LPS O-acetylase OafA/YrhL
VGGTVLVEARTDAPARGRPRDRFLDVVRSIAILRVVAWHTWGAPFLSWLVAAMPAMFFVTGSLLAASLDRRSERAVITDRLRRLLVPFWVFGAAAHAAMALAWWLRPAADTRIPWWQPLAWVLPIVDPVGTPWEATWLSRPLWYLRVVLWLLALTPLLRWAQRRWGLRLCAVPVALTVAAEVAAGHGWLASHPLVRFHLTDVATYSTFLLLGFWHHDGGTRRLSTSARWTSSAVGAVAALSWALWRGPSSWVVNDSPVLLLTVGWAWLWAFLALEPTLADVGTGHRTRPVIDWLARRSLTIYLWHTAAIVAATAILAHARLSAPVRVPLTAAFVAMGVLLATLLLGWVEDVAAGRPARFWPGRRTPTRNAVAATVAVAAVWGGLALVPHDRAAAYQPPPPSARPPELVFDAPVTTTTTTLAAPVAAAPTTTTTPLTQAQRIDRALADFARTWGDLTIAGTAFTVGPGFRWSGGTGTGFTAEDVVPAASVTKSVTSILANQLVDDGRLDLDAPITSLPGVPTWPAGAGITMRMLLEHTSGLLSYSEVKGFDPKARYSPAAAVALSLTAPFTDRPGTHPGYSNSGYLAAGLVLEQVTGRPYADLARDRVFRPLGMSSAVIDVSPGPGFVGHASGGLRASLPDLGRLARATYREGTLVSGAAFARMLPGKDQPGMGIAGFCPCTAEGGITAVGHDGGTVSARLFRDVGVVVVLRYTKGIYETEQRRDAAYELDHLVARIAAGRA